MATAWVDYLPYVLPFANGVPRAIAINAVREAAIELSERSLIWRVTLTAINVVEDQSDYTLSPPSGSRVVTPIYVEYDSLPIRPLSEEQLDAVSPSWRALGVVAHHYHLSDPLTLSLSWAPTESITGGLVVRVALKPTPNSTEADDILFNDWYRAIASGALHHLKSQPGTRWHDLSGAKMHGMHFKDGIIEARTRASASHSRAGTRVQMRPFA